MYYPKEYYDRDAAIKIIEEALTSSSDYNYFLFLKDNEFFGFNEFYELDEESLNRFFRGTKPSTIYDMIVGGSCSLNDLYFAEDNDSYCIETFDSAYDGISPHEIAEIIFDDELYEGIFDGYFNDKLSNFDEMLEDALIVEEI